MTPDLISKYLKKSIMEVILLCLCVALAFSANNFFSADNILNVLRNVSMQGIIAFGMTMVIISGEIDLSVGSMVAFSGCITAFMVQKFSLAGLPLEFSVLISVLLTLGIGFFIGSISGYLRVKFSVPTFITTLAWLTALFGISELITNGFPLTTFPMWYNFIGGGYLLGIPFPAIIFIFTFAVVYFIMNYTSYGRSLYAIGGNSEVARLSGINVNKIKISVMGIVALLASLSGILQSSEIMSGSANTAKGWELDVIASVIIGGTSLMGGAGSIRGTLIGVIFLGILVNGMTLLNINEYWQHVVRGALILCAVMINRIQFEKRA